MTIIVKILTKMDSLKGNQRVLNKEKIANQQNRTKSG